MPGFRIKYLSDLFGSGETDDLFNARRARDMYRRVAHCLESTCHFEVRGGWQWAEERSPNHHAYAKNRKNPTGLLYMPGDQVQKIEYIAYDSELKLYDFTLSALANSSGGVRELDEKSIEKKYWDPQSQYNFSLIVKDKLGPEELPRAKKDILKRFGEKENFHVMSGLSKEIDYAILQGYDPKTRSEIILEVGNRPRISKTIRKGLFKNIKTSLIPPKAIEIWP